VDAAALRKAIAERGIRAGLDVFEKEPAGGSGTFEDGIVKFPGVVGTHHVGASTEQAQNAIAAETVRIVAAFAATGAIPNAVNLASRTPATHLLTVRHRDRVGVLAHVFGVLKAAGINVQQTENVVFAGAEAACARIQVDQGPGPAVLDDIRSGCADVLSVGLTVL
jgi:D-3-phosphoglycerate dehydrogenase